MQDIKIPNYIAKDIDNANMNFFWKNNIDFDNGQASIHQISWEKICSPECEMGLGIRKIQNINAALLAKLG